MPARRWSTRVRPVGRRRWRRRLAYALLIGYALLMFVPFALVGRSRRSRRCPTRSSLTLIPQPFTLDGLASTSFNEARPAVCRSCSSTALIIAVAVTHHATSSSAASPGYAFARLRFPGREVLFLVVLATLMIPDQLRLVPVYLHLQRARPDPRRRASTSASILVLAISATSIFLMRQYFLSIPRDLEEAARIDGAGFFTTFWRVMLPLAGPALAAVAILQFQGTWNGFFWPLVLLQRPGPLHAAARAQLLPARRAASARTGRR